MHPFIQSHFVILTQWSFGQNSESHHNGGEKKHGIHGIHTKTFTLLISGYNL